MKYKGRELSLGEWTAKREDLVDRAIAAYKASANDPESMGSPRQAGMATFYDLNADYAEGTSVKGYRIVAEKNGRTAPPMLNNVLGSLVTGHKVDPIDVVRTGTFSPNDVFYWTNFEVAEAYLQYALWNSRLPAGKELSGNLAIYEVEGEASSAHTMFGENEGDRMRNFHIASQPVLEISADELQKFFGLGKKMSLP